MGETQYQARLIKRLEKLFPGAFIQKNDAARQQGIPDLTIFYGDRWAMLEVKFTQDSPVQPNQEYYVDLFNTMSFAAFVYPGNEEEVLNELQRSFGSRR